MLHVLVFGATYVIFTCLGHLSTSKHWSEIFFTFSIISLQITGVLNYIYFRYLLNEKIGHGVLILSIILVVVKAITLYIEPITVLRIDDIYVRTAHLYLPSVISTFIVLGLIVFEVSKLLRSLFSNPFKKKIAINLSYAYLLTLTLLALAVVASSIFLFSILLSLLQSVMISFLTITLYIFFRNKPISLCLLPINVFGILLHTYGGINIDTQILLSEKTPPMEMIDSLISSIIAAQLNQLDYHAQPYFHVYSFSMYKLIVYFSKMIVGSVVVNRDNIVLRQILKNIIEKIENALIYLDAGMITDIDIEIAKNTKDKFKPFLT